MELEEYTSGTGQKLRVHNKETCKGQHCCIHNPSGHHMVSWPTFWRSDRGFSERICPHGIGHPDPDDVTFFATKGWDISVHGCDGCCQG